MEALGARDCIYRILQPDDQRLQAPGTHHKMGESPMVLSGWKEELSCSKAAQGSKVQVERRTGGDGKIGCQSCRPLLDSHLAPGSASKNRESESLHAMALEAQGPPLGRS